MPRPDRRVLIADAAIELAAGGGNHAVTHQGVDRLLDLPKGSTSYYFRTREMLVRAAVTQLIERSRESFAELYADGEPTVVIADYLDDLITRRRTDVRARHALLTDPTLAEEDLDALARSLFSPEAALALMRSAGAAEPDLEATRLITVLEGVVLTYGFGLRREPAQRRRGSVAGEVRTLLRATFPTFS